MGSIAVRLTLPAVLLVAAVAPATPAEGRRDPADNSAASIERAAAPPAIAPAAADPAPAGDGVGSFRWRENRREYALVAAIGLLLAGAAIAFSLPPPRG